MTHLVASISAHGFGHLAISAPVLERLHELAPHCRITVTSGIAEAALRNRIRCPFEAVPDRHDFGLRMHRDLSIDAASTVADYAAIHAHWEARVTRQAEWLEETGCDLLLANISYLNIAAARRAGIPAVALCPLNWADLYRYYAPDSPACRAVFDQMVDAYNQADVFLAPRPCMPMPNFHKLETIAPIAQVGRDHRSLIRDTFDLDASLKLVLLALGGQEADFDVDELPALADARWIADDRWGLRRDDVLPLSGLALAFPDLLASCDLLVGKPGYGAFTEAACLGKPVVYMRRPDWPEEPPLIEWLQHQVPCREAPRGDPAALETAMREVLDAPRSDACTPQGIETAVRCILDRL